jgi:hypothetical protein
MSVLFCEFNIGSAHRSVLKGNTWIVSVLELCRSWRTYVILTVVKGNRGIIRSGGSPERALIAN